MARTVVATGSGLWVDGARIDDALSGRDVTSLVHGGDGRWYAVVDRRTVLRGQPGGDWPALATVDAAEVACITPVDGGVLAGTETARLVRVTDGAAEPLASFDDAPGRDRWYTPWGGPPAVRSLSTGSDGMIYANVHVGGIVRSHDGADWQPTIDVDVDVHQVLATDPAGRVVAALGDAGVAVSDDSAGTWSIETDGLHATYCRAVAVSGDTVLVSASTGPRGQRSALYQRTPDGAIERCTDGLPDWFDGNIDTFWLATAGGHCAFAGPDGSLYESDDDGRSWRQTGSGLGRVHAVVVTTAD